MFEHNKRLTLPMSPTIHPMNCLASKLCLCVAQGVEAEATRHEILELLETLLDLIRQHGTPTPSNGHPPTTTATPTPTPQNGHPSEASSPAAASTESAETLEGELRELARRLLPAYGGTMLLGDRALLRCLILMDGITRGGGTGGSGAGGVRWSQPDGLLSQAGLAAPILVTPFITHRRINPTPVDPHSLEVRQSVSTMASPGCTISPARDLLWLHLLWLRVI